MAFKKTGPREFYVKQLLAETRQELDSIDTLCVLADKFGVVVDVVHLTLTYKAEGSPTTEGFATVREAVCFMRGYEAATKYRPTIPAPPPPTKRSAT